MKPTTKDPKLEARRAKTELGDLVTHAMNPDYEGRSGAEAHGIKVVRAIVQEFILGESELAVEMRALLESLCDKRDPLRRDLRPEHWAVLWPTINTLTAAREGFKREQLERKAEAETQQPGARALGHGVRTVDEGEGR